MVRPDPAARLCLGSRWFGTSDRIVTYSARSLEPYRGFHIFMRTLPFVLRELPDAHILIVGDDGVSYGAMPAHASGWRQALLDELGDGVDPGRVHFLGWLNYRHYLAVLQISTVHVYMTYPFILSWGLLEALSAGCLVVGSRTPPVEEVLVDGKNGYLTDFFDIEGTARRVVELARAGRHDAIRAAARETILDRYALKRCLPAYLSVLRDLAGGRAPSGAILGRRGKDHR
jgi:glycosyltransferase involved in cell wall biosynthesis